VAGDRLVATRPSEASGRYFMSRLWHHMTPAARFRWVVYAVQAVQNGPAAVWVRDREPWEVDEGIMAALVGRPQPPP
jgi:hypothetical protein